METQTDIEKRIRRAREQDMEATLIQSDQRRSEDLRDHRVSERHSDPMVVEVENHDSTEGESIHTVIPETLYCGCWDSRTRVEICKHIAFLAERDDQIGATTREAIQTELESLDTEIQTLENELQDVRERRAQVETAQKIVFYPTDSMRLERGRGTQAAVDDNPEQFEYTRTGSITTNDTPTDPFQSMVNDLSDN